MGSYGVSMGSLWGQHQHPHLAGRRVREVNAAGLGGERPFGGVMGALRGPMGALRGPIVSLCGPMGSYGGPKGLKSSYGVSMGSLWGPMGP